MLIYFLDRSCSSERNVLRTVYFIFIPITSINFKKIGDGKEFKTLIVFNVIEDLPTSRFLEFRGVSYSKKKACLSETGSVSFFG